MQPSQVDRDSGKEATLVPKESSAARSPSISPDNTTTETVRTSAPASKTTSDDDRLPPGWKKVLSNSTGNFFYHHTASGTTSWDVPVAEPETKRSNEPKEERETDRDRHAPTTGPREDRNGRDRRPPTGPAASRGVKETERVGDRPAGRALVERLTPSERSHDRQNRDGATDTEAKPPAAAAERPGPPVHPDRAAVYPRDRGQPDRMGRAMPDRMQERGGDRNRRYGRVSDRPNVDRKPIAHPDGQRERLMYPDRRGPPGRDENRPCTFLAIISAAPAMPTLVTVP
jgi:hypothetical protein